MKDNLKSENNEISYNILVPHKQIIALKKYLNKGRAVNADTEQVAVGSLSFCLFEIDFMIESRTLVPIWCENDTEPYKF